MNHGTQPDLDVLDHYGLVPKTEPAKSGNDKGSNLQNVESSDAMTNEVTYSDCCGIESSDWHQFNGVREGFCPDCKEHCAFETSDEAGPPV